LTTLGFKVYSGQLRLSSADVAAVAGLPRLEALTLDGVENAGLADLVASAAVRSLRALQLSASWTSPLTDGVAALSRSPHLAGLVALTLERRALPASAVETLAGSPNLAGVFHLSLRENQLTDEAVEILAASRMLANVVTLNLSHNWLRKGAARALARSPHLNKLRELLVGGNHLDAEDLTLLRERFTGVSTNTHWSVIEGYNDFRRSDLHGVVMASLD
jgi:hypothetical protein